MGSGSAMAQADHLRQQARGLGDVGVVSGFDDGEAVAADPTSARASLPRLGAAQGILLQRHRGSRELLGRASVEGEEFEVGYGY